MEFYALDNLRFTSKFAYAEEIAPNYGPPDYCTACGKPLSMKKWLPPYKVVFEKPVYGDFVYGSFTEMLVSKKFMEAYKKTTLKGITFFHPVEIIKVRRKKMNSPEAPQYFKIEIERSKTLIDEKASNLIRDGTSAN